MKKKKRNLIQDFIKKKYFIKTEIKKLILKSIINDKNIRPSLRFLAKLKNITGSIKKHISNQNNNICIKTGKIKSTLKILKLSRFYIKKLAFKNNLQNFKIKKW